MRELAIGEMHDFNRPAPICRWLVVLSLVVAISLNYAPHIAGEIPPAEAVEQSAQNGLDASDQGFPFELGKFINLTQVDGAIRELKRNIQREWELERRRAAAEAQMEALKSEEERATEEEAKFMVVALGELRKFKQHMHKEQVRHEDLAMRRKLADLKLKEAREAQRKQKQQQQQQRAAAEERAKDEFKHKDGGGLLGSLSNRFSGLLPQPVDFELDDFMLFDGSADDDDNDDGRQKAPQLVPYDAVDDEEQQLERAETYVEYLRYIQRHNNELKEKTMGSIRERTREFVKTLFVDEAKELAFMMLQQLIMEQQVNLKEGTAKQLLSRLQMNLVKYLCGVLADVLAFVFGRKVLPPRAGEENSMNWMLYNMID